MIGDGKEGVLKEMDNRHNFPHPTEMLGNAFLKADLWLAEYYDLRLAPENLLLVLLTSGTVKILLM